MPSRAAALVKVVGGASKSSDVSAGRNRARRKSLAFGRDQVGIEADGHLEGMADTDLQIRLEQAPRRRQGRKSIAFQAACSLGTALTSTSRSACQAS